MVAGRKYATARAQFRTGAGGIRANGHSTTLYHLRRSVRSQCCCGWRSAAVPSDVEARTLGLRHETGRPKRRAVASKRQELTTLTVSKPAKPPAPNPALAVRPRPDGRVPQEFLRDGPVGHRVAIGPGPDATNPVIAGCQCGWYELARDQRDGRSKARAHQRHVVR